MVQLRELVRRRDADGLTFLMHATDAKRGTSRILTASRQPSMSEQPKYGQEEKDEQLVQDSADVFDEGSAQHPPPTRNLRNDASASGGQLTRQQSPTRNISMQRRPRDFTDIANAAALGFGLDRYGGTTSGGVGGEALVEEKAVDSHVPVVKAAIVFLRETMWKEEVSSPCNPLWIGRACMRIS